MPADDYPPEVFLETAPRLPSWRGMCAIFAAPLVINLLLFWYAMSTYLKYWPGFLILDLIYLTLVAIAIAWTKPNLSTDTKWDFAAKLFIVLVIIAAAITFICAMLVFVLLFIAISENN